MSAISRYPTILGLLLVAALIASGVAPLDRLTWLMETMPVMIVLPVLLATHAISHP